MLPTTPVLFSFSFSLSATLSLSGPPLGFMVLKSSPPISVLEDSTSLLQEDLLDRLSQHRHGQLESKTSVPRHTSSSWPSISSAFPSFISCIQRRSAEAWKEWTNCLTSIGRQASVQLMNPRLSTAVQYQSKCNGVKRLLKQKRSIGRVKLRKRTLIIFDHLLFYQLTSSTDILSTLGIFSDVVIT